MRAILVNAPESLVEQRRQQGIDKLDERWAGEWHLVNPPRHWHARLNTDLLLALAPLARRADLVPYGDATGVFAAADDWRVPDQAYARPEHQVEAGLSGAELVVEIRSPGDESYEKLPFYAGRGISEVLVVHEDRRIELYRLGEAAGYVQIDQGAAPAHSVGLGASFTVVEGPRLRITWEGGSVDV